MLKSLAACLMSLFVIVHICHANPATPGKCLNEISQAMEDANLDAFENLVDIDSILAQGTDQFLAQLQKPEVISQLNPMFALMLAGLGRQDAQGPRKLLIQEMHAFIGNGVASGAFAGKQVDNQQVQGLLAPLFANASLGRKEIRDIGETMQIENGWVVPFSIHDYGNGNTYPVIGRFTAGPNGLRLASIENLDQIFQQILMESSQ